MYGKCCCCQSVSECTLNDPPNTVQTHSNGKISHSNLTFCLVIATWQLVFGSGSSHYMILLNHSYSLHWCSREWPGQTWQLTVNAIISAILVRSRSAMNYNGVARLLYLSQSQIGKSPERNFYYYSLKSHTMYLVWMWSFFSNSSQLDCGGWWSKLKNWRCFSSWGSSRSRSRSTTSESKQFESFRVFLCPP